MSPNNQTIEVLLLWQTTRANAAAGVIALHAQGTGIFDYSKLL
jgi:hypothetical protein